MKPLDMPKAETKAEAKPVEAPVEVLVVEEKIDFSNVVIEPLFQDQVDFDTFSKSDFRAVKVLECEAVPKFKKLLKFTLDDGSGEKRTILILSPNETLKYLRKSGRMTLGDEKWQADTNSAQRK